MLEPFEEELGELLDTAHPAATLSEGWQGRARARMAAVTRRANRKERRSMRRLVYAMAFLLVIGLAVAGVFTRSRPPDAKALLISAAEAMEEAGSVHMLVHGTEMPYSESPVWMRMSPGYTELWVGPRAESATWVSSDGMVNATMGDNLDTGEVWSYSARMGGKMYVADMRPLGAKAERIVRKNLEETLAMFVNGQLGLGRDLHLKNMTESVTTEVRNGREVNLVAYEGDTNVRYTGETEAQGRPVRLRYVYELDAASGRLLSYRRYASVPGVDEQLVGASEVIDYDVPLPTDLRPDLGPLVPATLRIEETPTTLKMIMSANGEDIANVEVPK